MSNFTLPSDDDADYTRFELTWKECLFVWLSIVFCLGVFWFGLAYCLLSLVR